MTQENIALAEDLPLIDHRIMDDWCSDLDKSDILDLLSRVPGESYRCLTAIRQSAAEGDLDGAKRAAHCLKGMASNLGATRLAGHARGIETMSNDTEDVVARSVALEQTLVETLEFVQAYA